MPIAQISRLDFFLCKQVMIGLIRIIARTDVKPSLGAQVHNQTIPATLEERLVNTVLPSEEFT